jgi:hypothetical protein
LLQLEFLRLSWNGLLLANFTNNLESNTYTSSLLAFNFSKPCSLVLLALGCHCQVICYKSYVTSFMLQVICYKSYVTSLMLQVLYCKSYVTSHMLQVLCYKFYVTSLMLQVLCYKSQVASPRLQAQHLSSRSSSIAPEVTNSNVEGHTFWDLKLISSCLLARTLIPAWWKSFELWDLLASEIRKSCDTSSLSAVLTSECKPESIT